MSQPVMEITLVKAAGPGDRDRAYLKSGDAARRGAVHVIHDRPHLVVESLFGITDGLWAELAAGSHAAAGQAASAREAKRQKQGADRLRGGSRCPDWRVAHAWAPPGQDDHELRDQPRG